MKHFVFFFLPLSFLANLGYSQRIALHPGDSIENKLHKGEKHLYVWHLNKGEYGQCIVNQKGVDVAIDVMDPSGKKLGTFDSPNGAEGPEPVSIKSTKTGDYRLYVYPLIDQVAGMSDSAKASVMERNQGAYSITSVTKISQRELDQSIAQEKNDEAAFVGWIGTNAHEIKTVDAGNGFQDLQPLQLILKDVHVVGLGEASHGTSEFFRMKHRMLEFLVKKMGFTSFLIEASMSRCRYINDYVLYGKGNLDTATAIQGFTTWRVDEVRNMIEWLRQYNATVPDSGKVQFMGFDLQINDNGWKGLKEFYSRVNPGRVLQLDSLKTQVDSAASWSNTLTRQQEGADLYKLVYEKSLAVMDDIILNEGAYERLSGKDQYRENVMNIKLIVQEIESYKDGYNDRRDYYMAQNILYLLNSEKPGAKVAVWAHNGHIGKSEGSMGSFLDKVLKQDYYAIGFEFYEGSFLSRDLDTATHSKNWDIITIGEPPIKSLPWYLNGVGMDKLFIDLRNTGADKLRNFPKQYSIHSFGSMYSKKWPQTYPETLQAYDGMIYIKTSTAAKSSSNVLL